jgi:hypothetical protein
LLLIGIEGIGNTHKTSLLILTGFNVVKMMELTTETMLDTVLTIEEVLSEKQLIALRDILYFYKEFELELYNYPPEDTLFTQTQRELFDIFDVK